jgi:histone deacetylase 4/5
MAKTGNVVYPDSPLIGSSEIKFISTNKAIHLELVKVFFA